MTPEDLDAQRTRWRKQRATRTPEQLDAARAYQREYRRKRRRKRKEKRGVLITVASSRRMPPSQP
jgi:hypothetical protein